MYGELNNDKGKLSAMSVREFCGRYGLGHTLVYELIKRGELRAVKVGTRTLLLAKDILDWERRLESVGRH